MQDKRRTGRTSRMLVKALGEQLRAQSPVIVVARSNQYAHDLRKNLHLAIDQITFRSISEHRRKELNGNVDKSAQVFFDHHGFE